MALSYRVCTEFLSKIQDFHWTFSKTIISFSRLKVMKQVINRELKKILQEQSFFHDRQARLNKISQTQKTFHLRSTCCSFKKKNQDFLPFFQDFTSILQTFSGSGKVLGKCQDVFKNSRLCTNPVSNRYLTRKTQDPYPVLWHIQLLYQFIV